jgi:putative transcriptional regulator
MAKRRAEYEWDAKSIKALRKHMDLSQQALADELGMRQQTISEWETGMYKPRRSTSKYLSLIAERAGFEYTVGQEKGESVEEGQEEEKP